MTRVGIPQGLFYNYYYPLFKTFFQDLGVTVRSSGNTNRKIINMGIQTAVDEACFPVKVFFGHVLALCQEDVDYIFLPRMVSVEARSYICPKFMGLPDMIEASIPDHPPFLKTLVDLSRNDRQTRKEMIQLGSLFGGKRTQILKAYRHGREELQNCRNLAAAGYTLSEAISVWEGHDIQVSPGHDLKIGVLGHGYSLYDPAVSMDIIGRLRAMGCQVELMEMLDRSEVEAHAAQIPKRVFWTLGRLMVGSALQMKEDEEVDGIIYLACFGCGPDSLVGEIIERKMQNQAFMFLTIDEHSGEAGLQTRLEAFCDMLRRRRVLHDESQLSAFR